MVGVLVEMLFPGSEICIGSSSSSAFASILELCMGVDSKYRRRQQLFCCSSTGVIGWTTTTGGGGRMNGLIASATTG